MKKILFILASLFVYSGMMGQDPYECNVDEKNLVNNPGFECYRIGTAPPPWQSYPGWGWNGITRLNYPGELGWWSVGIGTPDHFHRDSPIDISRIPDHIATEMNGINVNIETDGGTPNNGYYGLRIRTESSTGTDYMKYEYISTKLRQPLKAGGKYKVKFKTRLSSLNSYYPQNNTHPHYALEKIGLLFTHLKTSPWLPGHAYDNLVYKGEYDYKVFKSQLLEGKLTNTNYIDQLNWNEYEFTFEYNLEKELNYLTVGWFEDSKPIYHNANGYPIPSNGKAYAYYYFDDFYVEDITCTFDCEDFINDLKITQEGCCINIKLENSQNYECLEKFSIQNDHYQKYLLKDVDVNEIITTTGLTLCPEDYSWFKEEQSTGQMTFIFTKINGVDYNDCAILFQYSECVAEQITPIFSNSHGDCCYDLSFQKNENYTCEQSLTVYLQEIDENGDKVGSAKVLNNISGTIEICNSDGDGTLRYQITYKNPDDVCVGFDEIEIDCVNCCIDIDIQINNLENDCCHWFDINQENLTCNAIDRFEVYDMANPELIIIAEDYNPSNTSSDDFCLYTDDESNLKIIFKDAQNDTICEKFITLPGCSCKCPDDLDDWIDLSLQYDTSECPDNCRVVHNSITPNNINCFKDFEIITETELIDQNGNISYITNTIPKDDIDNLKTAIINLNSIDNCLDMLRWYKFTLKLYKENGEVCEIDKKLFCYNKKQDQRADCQDPEGCTEPYEKQKDIVLDIPSTAIPGYSCNILIEYETRKCGDWQDVHIIAIKYTSWLSPALCPFETKELFKMVLSAIAKKNDMDFEPKDRDECNEMWRITKASCWYKTTTYIQMSLTGDWVREVVNYNECNSECCARRIRVCRNLDGTVTITDLGILYSQLDCSEANPIELGNNDECFYTCNSLEGEQYTSKVNIINEDSEIFKTNQNDLFIELSLNIKNTNLYMKVIETNCDNIELTIFDIKGNKVHSSKKVLNSSFANINVDLNKYNSGAYVYELKSNNVKIKTGKFILSK